MEKILKIYVIVASIVSIVLIAFLQLTGGNISQEACLQSIAISFIATAVVMVIWFLVGYMLVSPFVRFLNQIFQAIR